MMSFSSAKLSTDHPEILDLLVDDRVEAEVGDADAAVLLGRLEPDEACRRGLAPERAVDHAPRLPVIGVGHRLALEERTHRLAELLVNVVVDRPSHRANGH